MTKALHEIRVAMRLLNIFIQSKDWRKLCPSWRTALAKRLDDSSNVIRISSCKSLSNLIVGYAIFNDNPSLKYIIENLLVHLDDPSDEIRQCGLFVPSNYCKRVAYDYLSDRSQKY